MVFITMGDPHDCSLRDLKSDDTHTVIIIGKEEDYRRKMEIFTRRGEENRSRYF